MTYGGGHDGPTSLYRHDDEEPEYERPKNDKPEGDQPKHDEPEYERPKYDEPMDDKPGYDEPKDDKPDYDKPKDDKPDYDKPKDDKPKDDKPKCPKPIYGAYGDYSAHHNPTHKCPKTPKCPKPIYGAYGDSSEHHKKKARHKKKYPKKHVCPPPPIVTPPPVVTPPVVTPPIVPVGNPTPVTTPPSGVTQPPVTPAPTLAGTPPPSTLTVIKRGPRAARANQTVVFTITVKNTSTVVASTVTLSDLLPAGYSVATLPKGARFVKGKLVLSLGDLAPGASVTIRIRVRLDRTVRGNRCNVVEVSAGNAPVVSAQACTRIIRVRGVSRTPVTG